MTDDRYEVKGKIGQGGLGAVYRAYDKRLNREVAIKRVLPEGGFDSQDEAIERFLKEATALSSIQHPHIVTIYDAAVDDDGPYVVMELLTGRTIDQMVERGTLTYDDFREVAIQTQEALIAAQELNLVHRDLKPANLMVVWLPSGKFQVKLVDFGLAKFSAKPSVQTIDHGDAVFGSVHFMAPEQFERTALDQRTDMYAMGCLYYYTLTGSYPFTGDTAPQVMSAHLKHTVIDLKEVRPDLPAWTCDWVMWHLNRSMDDRPQDARESLQNFIMNDQQAPHDAAAAPPGGANRPKFVFPEADQGGESPAAPGTGPVPVVAAADSRVTPTTAPQPLEPPEGQKPSVHTTTHVTASAEPEEAAPPPAPPAVPASMPPAAATPGAPPLTAIPVPDDPSAVVQPVVVPEAAPDPAAIGEAAVLTGSTATGKSKGLSTAAKGTIAAVLGIAVIFLAFLVISKVTSNKAVQRINDLLAPVADIAAKDLPLTGDEARLLLEQASRLAQDSQRQAIYKRLLVSVPSDASDLDAIIAKYATDESNPMVTDIRIRLFQVIQGRKGASALPYLIDYAKTAENPKIVTAALKATQKIATEDDLTELLDILQFTDEASVRQAAEGAIASVATRSDSRATLAAALKRSYETAPNDDVKHSYLRLLGFTGGDDAAEIVQGALRDPNKKTQIAAISAMRTWPDDSQFNPLIKYIGRQSDEFLRHQAFESAYNFLRLERDWKDADLEKMWKMLASEASTRSQKEQVITGVAKFTTDWAFRVVDSFLKDEDDKVSFRAERAREYMEGRQKRLQNGTPEE